MRCVAELIYSTLTSPDSYPEDEQGAALAGTFPKIFEFEGDVHKSALRPARFERVQRQLEAVSPWVDETLVYQYMGMMNKPGSAAFAGSPLSTRLYTDYINWLGHRGYQWPLG